LKSSSCQSPRICTNHGNMPSSLRSADTGMERLRPWFEHLPTLPSKRALSSCMPQRLPVAVLHPARLCRAAYVAAWVRRGVTAGQWGAPESQAALRGLPVRRHGALPPGRRPAATRKPFERPRWQRPMPAVQHAPGRPPSLRTPQPAQALPTAPARAGERWRTLRVTRGRRALAPPLDGSRPARGRQGRAEQSAAHLRDRAKGRSRASGPMR